MKPYDEIQFPNGFLRWVREDGMFVCRMSEEYFEKIKLQHEAQHTTSPEPVMESLKALKQEVCDAVGESHFAPHQWVGLTDGEIDQGLLRTNYAMQTAGAWRDGVEWAQSQLKEKNHDRS